MISEDKRVYPKGALAPQLLGFVGGDDYSGIAGLELEYDEVLSGEPGEMQVVSDHSSGNRVATVSTKEAVPGESITLTIDEQIQYKTEQVLAGVVAQFKAKKAFAVVIDPDTGEILAMANTPVFDTNEYASDAFTEADRRNAVVTDQYEPGSTFKMVAAAAALEAGLVTSRHDLPPGPRDHGLRPDHPRGARRRPGGAKSHCDPDPCPVVQRGRCDAGSEVGKDVLAEMIQKFGFMENAWHRLSGRGQG